MKNYVRKYGLISVGILMVFNLIILAVLGVPGPEDYKQGEVIGYTIILLALSVIFFGVKQYRDQVLNGFISFGSAFKLGVLITIFPAIAFGLYNYVYMEIFDPAFIENYWTYMLEGAQEKMSADEFVAYRDKMEANKSMYMNVFLQSALMFFTVFIIGTILSCIAGMIFKRKSTTLVA